MNEAIFMTDRERTQVTGIIERFYRLRDRKGIVDVEATTYQGRQTGVKIRVDDQEKEFVKSPCSQPWDGYVNAIKGWLFDRLEE